jgi:hypothetical protein
MAAKIPAKNKGPFPAAGAAWSALDLMGGAVAAVFFFVCFDIKGSNRTTNACCGHHNRVILNKKAKMGIICIISFLPSIFVQNFTTMLTPDFLQFLYELSQNNNRDWFVA